MELLLELVTYDDAFLWTVWLDADRREATLQIGRG